MSAMAQVPWHIEELAALDEREVRNAHRVHDGDRAIELCELYFRSANYLARPTRAFGYFAKPEKSLDGEPFPAILLIHGGGGTADARWARHWAQRGYAAFAPDLYGQGPNHAKLPDGGPDWSDDFASFRLTNGLENTWIYQAVATCVAISALVRMPGVDANRLAVTGQSWGGYFCSTVMSIDHRVRVGMPMFGCGFSPRVATGPSVSKIREEEGRIQREAFEPGNFLPRCHKPVLWVTHPTDTPPDELEKSYRATPGPNTLCVTNLPGHVNPAAIGNGYRPELVTFADSHFRGTDPLATLGQPTIATQQLHVTYASPVPVRFATVHWTTEIDTIWHERKWQTKRATIRPNEIVADLPAERSIAYVAVADERGCVVTSEFVNA